MSITNEQCYQQIDKFSLETPDSLILDAYVERANGYGLSVYSPAVATALAINVVVYLVLFSGARELSSRGADGANQSFKNKDALKQLKKMIKALDDKGIIKDLPTDGSGGYFMTVGGYV